MIPSPDPVFYLLKPLLAALLLFGSAHGLGRHLSSWIGLEPTGLAERLAVRGALGLGSLLQSELLAGGASLHPAVTTLPKAKRIIYLIQSGGGNGPKKPSNRSAQRTRCQLRPLTGRDERADLRLLPPLREVVFISDMTDATAQLAVIGGSGF